MNRKPLAGALCALLLAAAGTAVAQPPPPDGLAAEMRQDWATAARIYREHLQTDSKDVALWKRLADVEAHRGHDKAAAQALGQAAALRSDDANLQLDYAHALAQAGEREAALQAIGRVLALQPDNEQALQDQVQLANWNGDYALAHSSLDKLHALDPKRDVDDGLARAAAWQGDLGQATTLMSGYVGRHPDDRTATLDLARFRAWRGDYAGSLDTLDGYDTHWPSDPDAQALRARVLAWANWRHDALAINTPLLDTHPHDYGLNYTQAIALRDSLIPRDAQPYVDKARAIKPDSAETRDLIRSMTPPLRSRITVPFWHSWDSDHISVWHAGAELAWMLKPRSTLLVDAGRNRYEARAGSPFIAPDGSTRVTENRARIGWRQAFNGNYAVEAWVGGSNVGHGGGSTAIGSLSLIAEPSDPWHWRLTAERDRIGISPRAMALGITRNGAVADMRWRPDLRWTLDAFARNDSYSDGNNRHEVAFALRRATVRNEHLNLDLGVAGQWLGFSDNPGHGYYSPNNYRRVALTVGTYFHLAPEVGLSLQGALGLQRDENTNGWRSANDINGVLTLGIFTDWQLRIRAAYTQRRQATGAYDGRLWGVTLERRF